MATEILNIGTMKPEAKDGFMFDVGRQEDMDGRNGEAVRRSIDAALASGKTVEAQREMNTNTILHLVVDGKTVIDKHAEAAADLAKEAA
jgi:hypothetical protein